MFPVSSVVIKGGEILASQYLLIALQYLIITLAYISYVKKKRESIECTFPPRISAIISCIWVGLYFY